MADSLRELAVQALIAKLTAAGKPAELAVHRFRLRPLLLDDLPAVAVFAMHQDASRPSSRHSERQQNGLIVGLEFRVEGDGPDVMLEPYLVWAEQTLCGDRLLNGVVENIALKSIDWGGKAEERQFGVALMQFVLQWSSQVGDPTTF